MTQIKILPRRFTFAEAHSKTDVNLKIFLKSEMDSADPSVTVIADQVKRFTGKISDGIIYPVDVTKNLSIGVIDSISLLEKNTLDNETPGQSHVSALIGSKISTMIAATSLLSEKGVLCIELSQGTRMLVGHREQFIVGFEQQAISNSYVNEKPARNVLLDPEFFRQEDFFSASSVSDGMLIARSLVNSPANHLNPSSYSHFVADLIEEWKPRFKGEVSFECYDKSRLENDGAELILAVGAAAKKKPRILRLQYTPSEIRAEKKIAIIGKGITYDTGGLDIKPSAGMRIMKKDMGGSAAVLGTFLSLALSGYGAKVTAWLPLAENAISAESYRPGDVYRALNGKLIEIENTDAEGRLVLADALCYASREKPDILIDVATLTGAARVAMGPEVDSAFTNRKEYVQLMKECGVETGDWVWPTPRVPKYRSYFESSNIADMENGGGRFAGAIVGAQFLEHFIDGLPWMHFDSYMWAEKANLMAKEPGANPKMVRILREIMDRLIR